MGPTSKGRGGRGREKGEGERKRGEDGGGEGREPPPLQISGYATESRYSGHLILVEVSILVSGKKQLLSPDAFHTNKIH